MTTTIRTPAAGPARAARPTRPAKRRGGRRQWIAWLFIAPFGVVFLAFLVAPLFYAFGLSLFTHKLATGNAFVGLANYAQAFTDPLFLGGVLFVLLFSLVLIPVQMVVSLAAALVLDSLTTKLANFSRLMIFVPYAVPAVIGALMWGFLYSPQFGPLTQFFALFHQTAPNILDSHNVFGGLINVVNWQWAGYYMIIIYAALRGIDSSVYEAAEIDGANAWQIAVRVKVPMVASALVLILVFALIGTFQFFTEPTILTPSSNGAITPSYTPNIYAYTQAFSYTQFNYASALSFALGAVVFIAVYIFLFATRKKGRIL